MVRNRIRAMKLLCFAFAFIWVIHVINRFIKYYNDAVSSFDSTIFPMSIFGFWLGILMSLIISSGFTFLFWSSYFVKYKDEKISELIPKKIITFLIAVGIFKLAFGISIFKLALFFTFVIYIKYLERTIRAQAK